jgi:expansin (peptidoglycan-binding protein)
MHHLKNLKGLGFKTFSDVIDESYDEMPKIDDRIKKIIDNLNTIKKDPVNFWNATIDIREHNYSILKDLLERDKNSLVPFEDLI